MALVDADVFGGQEVECIYIAARRTEARQVEDVLSAHRIDYSVDIEPFESTLLGLFTTERDGVGFYVIAGQADFCRRILRDARLVQGLVDRDEVAGD